jgi:hypothetical protein
VTFQLLLRPGQATLHAAFYLCGSPDVHWLNCKASHPPALRRTWHFAAEWAQAPPCGLADDQRPVTVDVEDEGLSPELCFSFLKTVATATTQATWNKKPQRYLHRGSRIRTRAARGEQRTHPNTAETNPEKPPSLSPNEMERRNPTLHATVSSAEGLRQQLSRYTHMPSSNGTTIMPT